MSSPRHIVKPLVVIESPYAGNIGRNLRYLGVCILDSLNRGEAPIASHGLFPQWLDDDDAISRAQGIAAGHAWLRRADLCAVYVDLGKSDGMLRGESVARREGVVIQYRELGARWEK